MTTTTTTPTLTVEPLSAAIGATVHGLDLRDLDDHQAARLRAVVVTHGVVFLRDQTLDDGDLRALAGRFGTLARSPLHRLLGSTRTTSTIEDTAERPPAGFDWHTDLSWIAAPPAFGFLHALEIPAVGGDTLWACQQAAFAALPGGLQDRCVELAAEHRCDAGLLATIGRHHGDDVVAELRRRHRPVTHPLVVRHPESGVAGLFLSPMYLHHLVGLDRRRGAHLLRALGESLTDPHHQVRWRWREGDVAIWDERSTCHRALTDHFPQRRRMARCVVEGEAPVPAGRSRLVG